MVRSAGVLDNGVEKAILASPTTTNPLLLMIKRIWKFCTQRKYREDRLWLMVLSPVALTFAAGAVWWIFYSGEVLGQLEEPRQRTAMEIPTPFVSGR